MAEAGTISKFTAGIIITLLLAGISVAVAVEVSVLNIQTSQQQILKIEEQQVQILQALSTNLTVAMERQITDKALREQLKEFNEKKR